MAIVKLGVVLTGPFPALLQQSAVLHHYLCLCKDFLHQWSQCMYLKKFHVLRQSSAGNELCPLVLGSSCPFGLRNSSSNAEIFSVGLETAYTTGCPGMPSLCIFGSM